MIGNDLHFLHPGWVWLFWGAFLFLLLWLYHDKKKEKEDALWGDSSLLEKMVQPPSKLGERAKRLLLTITFLAGVVTLLSPVGNPQYVGGGKEGAKSLDQILLVLDVSRSMGVKDKGQSLTRLEIAKQIVNDLLPRLGGHFVSLYTFTEKLDVVVPKTADLLFVRLTNNSVTIDEPGVGGTDFVTVLSELQKELKRGIGQKVLFISDGGDTLLETGDKSREKEIVNLAHSLEVPIITVGIGGSDFVPIQGLFYQERAVFTKLNSSILQKMGTTYFAKDGISSNTLAEEIAKSLMHKITSSQNTLQYDYYFQIPLFIALAALLVTLLLPRSRGSSTLLVFLVFLTPLRGEEDYTAMRADALAAAGELSSALALYDPLLENGVSPIEYAVIQFNIGTLYLRNERYKEALVAFYEAETKETPNYLLGPLEWNRDLALTGLASEAISKGDFALALVAVARLGGGHTKMVDSLQNQIFTQKSALENALARQENVHRLLLYTVLLGKQQSFQKMQEAVVEKANLYPSEILAKEKSQFPLHCQKTPWSSVVPSFVTGLAAARMAELDFPVPQILTLQETAIRSWKEAVKSENMQQTGEKESKRIDERQALIEMDLQDRKAKPKAVREQVERPW